MRFLRVLMVLLGGLLAAVAGLISFLGTLWMFLFAAAFVLAILFVIGLFAGALLGFDMGRFL